jgi:hypothetical protein
MLLVFMARRTSLFAELPATPFANLQRRSAVAIAIATLSAIVVLLTVALNETAVSPAPADDEGDLALYGGIVSAMRLGVPYYEAAHAALLAGGYGTTSVFNWRLPTLAFLQSMAPYQAMWTATSGALAVGALLLMVAAMARTAGTATATLATVTLTAGLVAFATPAGAQFSEIFAGMLILASAGAYGLRWRALAVLLALAALFVRELSGIYVLVCIYLAWREGERKELAAWAGGLLCFAVFFVWHYMKVKAQLGPTDIAYPDGWVQFGGLQFVLATASFNGILTALPRWVSAIVLPLALLGLVAGGRTTQRAMIAVFFYISCFAIAGKPFNAYWGALYTPLLMVGAAFAPAAIRDLGRTLSSERRGGAQFTDQKSS